MKMGTIVARANLEARLKACVTARDKAEKAGQVESWFTLSEEIDRLLEQYLKTMAQGPRALEGK